jgi:hypothetical protein
MSKYQNQTNQDLLLLPLSCRLCPILCIRDIAQPFDPSALKELRPPYNRDCSNFSPFVCVDVVACAILKSRSLFFMPCHPRTTAQPPALCPHRMPNKMPSCKNRCAIVLKTPRNTDKSIISFQPLSRPENIVIHVKENRRTMYRP